MDNEDTLTIINAIKEIQAVIDKIILDINTADKFNKAILENIQKVLLKQQKRIDNLENKIQELTDNLLTN